MSEIIAIFIGLLGLALGVGVGYFLRKQMAQAKANSVEAIAEKHLAEVKTEEGGRRDIRKRQEHVEQRESMFDKQLLEFEERKTKLQEKVEEIKQIKERIDRAKEETDKKLQTVAGYTKEQALEELYKALEKEAAEELIARKLKLDRGTHEELEVTAREIMVTAMERPAQNHAAETTSTAVPLTSDEMKGRIIGKDGRNIKTIEKLTGCELIIDETPEMIL